MSQKAADAAIEGKFERIGRLRAAAMDAGLSGDDLYGIDPEFIKARLKGSDDILKAMRALEKGFSEEAGDLIKTNSDMASYLSQIVNAQKVEESAMNNELIRIAGLSANSQFAHASAMVRLGKSAHDSLIALDNMFDARTVMSNMAEANFSKESMTLAQNILDVLLEDMEKNSSILKGISKGTENEAELAKYMSGVKSRQLGEKVLSMIYGAAEGSESSTVQDVLDSMERLANTSRMRKAKGYSKLLTITGDENDLINLKAAADQSRRIKALERRANIKSLNDQLDNMIQSLETAQPGEIESERLARKAFVLDQSRSILESRVRMGSASSDDHKLAASLMGYYGEEISGLDEETKRVSNQVLELSNAKRYLKETGFDEILKFGGRSSASNFAPQALDLDEDTQKKLFYGLDEQGALQDVSSSSYKRVTESWKNGKLGEAFGNPIVKKSAYAVAGLLAASFIYSGVKDRGEQEISGPPLLPGGSAYEQLPQRTPQIPNQSMFSGYNRGTGYTVHLEGSREQIESFGQSAGSVARGPINSTMSRGLPRLGRDPYSEIAGSF